MSILIKGMEMPKDVPLLIQVSPNGRVKLYNTKRTILTAVEVKPHGRLVDADKLLLYCDEVYGIGSKVSVGAIINAPTVIESTMGQVNDGGAVNKAEGEDG